VHRGEKDVMPRQGSKTTWKVLMDYGRDRRIVLDDPVDDGVLPFEKATADAVA
jgi:monooxygenase